MSEMLRSNEMSVDSVVEYSSSDEESSISIGGISVDDYYDEKCYDNNLFAIENTPYHELPIESTNGVNNDASTSTEPKLMIAGENLLQAIPPRKSTFIMPKIKRKAAIKARVAIVKSIPKRRTLKVLKEDKRRIDIIESGGEPDQRKARTLKAYGIIRSKFFDDIYLHHEQLIKYHNYLTCVPAKRTVEDILTRYSVKKKACFGALNYFLNSFNAALPHWCLREIEKLQHENMVKKNPNLPMSRIYGLPHLVHFIVYLPLLLMRMSVYGPDYMEKMTKFTAGFMTYMVEEEMCLDIETSYENVMPEYYRMTYPNRTRRLAPPPHSY